MPDSLPATDLTIDAARGPVVVRRWRGSDPRVLVIIAHGYGEHSGRYDHVARALVDTGAVVYAPDHYAHGRTAADGELAAFDDLDDLVAGLESVASSARAAHPGLPVALVGHSMGGIIAARYVQKHGADSLDALVLSAPAIGGNAGLAALLEMDPIPDVPLDPSVLSRDPQVGDDYAADPLVYHGPFRRSTLAAMVKAVDAVQAGPGFGALPVLWVHGELDELAALDATRPVVEALASVLETHVYAGAMHKVFNETNREEVLSDVIAFLRRVSPPASGRLPVSR
jgi:alpha-beta hydrolase superfamily lysophospholipase